MSGSETQLERFTESSGALITAYQSGQIGAQDLVKGAIANHRLSPQALNDQAYLNAVAT